METTQLSDLFPQGSAVQCREGQGGLESWAEYGPRPPCGWGSLLTLLGGIFTVDDPGQAKVTNFAAQGLRHQDVGRPEVAVN